MPPCILLPLDPWHLLGVKVTALGAVRVCAGNKATRSKPRDPLVCRALPKKQTLRTAGLLLREVKPPAQEPQQVSRDVDTTGVRSDGQ